MPQQSSKRRLTKGKTVGIIFGAFSVIGCAIVVTLALRGELSLEGLEFDGVGLGKKYKNVTLTDALLECQEKAKDQFDQRLKHLTFDRHSSRFDEKSNRFKMYFRMDLLPNKESTKPLATPYFLNCFVHGSNGRVTHFESVQDTNDNTRPIRKPEGGLFGY